MSKPLLPLPALSVRRVQSTWVRFKRSFLAPLPSNPSVTIDTDPGQDEDPYHPEDDTDDREVDEVVVDRLWSEYPRLSVANSDWGVGSVLAKDSLSASVGQPPGNTVPGPEFTAHSEFWTWSLPLTAIRWRLWPALNEFFSSRFADGLSEKNYQQESWYIKKSLAIWSSFFLVFNWMLGSIFIVEPEVLADKIFYFGVAPALTLPIIVMIVYNFPSYHSNFYQTVLLLSTWSWSFFQVFFMYFCGYYNRRSALFSCGNKDFMNLFYYTAAIQTISLFGLRLKRFTAIIGAAVFLITSCSLIVPLRDAWGQNMVNFAIFHCFLVYLHYRQEHAERRLYNLRDQLRLQFKATQKAQVNERKTADSKRRLTSYVFHDKSLDSRHCDDIVLIQFVFWTSIQVRVPLNTALLAVQNMEASGAVAKSQEIEFNALEGSLSIMSKVLNDVLDFNRMDSGRLETASRPYAFHQVMRSLFVHLQLATDSRKLEFVIDLDRSIDLVARCAEYEARGESPAQISKLLEEHPEGDGIVVGDETRLRQIITNLATNACKFTPAGGKLSISTRLVLPCPPAPTRSENSDSTRVAPSWGQPQMAHLSREDSSPVLSDNDNDTKHANDNGNGIENHHEMHSLSTKHLFQHNSCFGKVGERSDGIVVRIEVSDTGCGIKYKDMVENKLFSAFNQTEQGRQQGGKGTGLGLALVRQIVKLSGGRLGVRSRVGHGSTFWIELPLGVGVAPETMKPSEQHATEPHSPIQDAVRKDMALADSAAALRENKISSASERCSSLLQSRHGTEHDPVSHPGLATSTIPCLPVSREPASSSHLASTVDEPSKEPECPQRPRLNKRLSFGTIDSHCTINSQSLGKPLSSKISPRRSVSSHATQHSGSPLPMPLEGFSPGLDVLVVDDDPLTRTLMTRLLTRLGCNVTTAENGAMALDMIVGETVNIISPPNSPGSPDDSVCGPTLEEPERQRCEKYAVIFLDNQMPVLSGLTAVKRLRELNRRDFIVGITGNALLTDQKEYLEAGADHVLIKPVLERSLRSMLAKADERRKCR